MAKIRKPGGLKSSAKSGKTNQKPAGKLGNKIQKSAKSSSARKSQLGRKPKRPAGKLQEYYRKIDEKIDPVLIILSLVVLLLLIVSLLFLTGSSEPEYGKSSLKNESDFEICVEPECPIVSSYLIKHMDPDVDPCDDFHSAACGKFDEAHVYFYGAKWREIVLAGSELMRILNSSKSISEAEKNTNVIYNKCLKNAENIDSLLKVIKKLGGCPALDRSWNERNFDLTGTIIEMAKIMPEHLGIFKFEAFSTAEKMRINLMYEPVKYNANIDQILQKIITSKSIVQTRDMVKYQKEAVKMGDRINAAKPREITVDREPPKIAIFDMARFKKNIIDREIEFVTQSSSYFTKDLNKILKTTNRKAIQNFLIFQFIGGMDYPFFERNIYRKQRNCIEKLKKLIPGTLGMAYVHRMIKPENVAAAEKMVEDLKVAYIERFKKSDWIDGESFKKASEKVKKMKYYTGYPKHLEDDAYFKKMYKNFDISPSDTFFETALKIHSSYAKDFFLTPFKNETLHLTTEFLTWNAWFDYANILNIASLPVKLPFFDAVLPYYYSFGTLGTLIGHEIGHGFDTNAMGYANLWSNKTGKSYKAKTDCLRDQYSKLKYYGNKLDGNLTLAENIADTFGFMNAYYAMKSKLAGKKDNEILILPGLQQFTPEQIFFYGYANTKCSSPDSNPEETLKDTHTPGMLRLNAVVSNLDEFAEAFNCKPNSPMNPIEKCKLL